MREIRSAYASLNPRSLVIDLARCWHYARRSQRSAQMHLSRVLEPLGCEMLAPALNMFFSSFEAQLGRSPQFGYRATVTSDERKLAAIIESILGDAADLPAIARRLQDAAIAGSFPVSTQSQCRQRVPDTGSITSRATSQTQIRSSSPPVDMPETAPDRLADIREPGMDHRSFAKCVTRNDA